MISKKRAKKMTDKINTELTIGTRWRIFRFIHVFVNRQIKEVINTGKYETVVYIDDFTEAAQNKIIDYLINKGYEIHLSMELTPKITINWKN